MQPLVYPGIWPPPPIPPLKEDHWAMRIPLLGGLAKAVICSLHERRHIYDVWGPIADEIQQQLESRPPINEHSPQSDTEKIMAALAKAVCREKGIAPPRQLHQDDPAELIFYGYDDLSPLEFRINLEQSMGIRLSRENADKIVECGMTAGEIAALVLDQEAGSLKQL